MPGPNATHDRRSAPKRAPSSNSPTAKVRARLAARIADWEASAKNAVTEIHKPGSQNRKK